MKWLKSFGYAFQGLGAAWNEQLNFRIHCGMMVFVIALGFYFRIRPLEWCTILLAGGLVISLELINSAIESLTDRVSPERSPLAGKVKDISAAAVLIAATASLAVGVIIFGPYLF